MAQTRISDVVVPEVFNPYISNYTTQKSELIRTGALTTSETLNTQLQNGGMVFETPYFKDLERVEERISSDTIPPDEGAYNAQGAWGQVAGYQRKPEPQKIGTFQGTSIRLNRNQSWQTSDLSEALAGADPMAEIASKVGDYWMYRTQVAFISTWLGVLADNTANDNGDLTLDVSSNAFIEGSTNFTAGNFIDCQQLMGDEMNRLSVMFVHSMVYSRMRKNNLIDFILDSDGNPNIPTFQGVAIVVDDAMVVTGEPNKYRTWLFGAGATLFGDAPPEVPTEIVREAAAGNGGGAETLYQRKQMVIAPVGFRYTGSTASGGGPTNAVLSAAATWDRVFPERKQIRFAQLITREA